MQEWKKQYGVSDEDMKRSNRKKKQLDSED